MKIEMRYSSESIADGKQKLTADARDGSFSAQVIVSTPTWKPYTVAVLLRRWAQMVEDNGSSIEVDVDAKERQ